MILLHIYCASHLLTSIVTDHASRNLSKSYSNLMEGIYEYACVTSKIN